MEKKLRTELEFLEWEAHICYGTELGTFYWQQFLIKEVRYNATYGKYKRRIEFFFCYLNYCHFKNF